MNAYLLFILFIYLFFRQLRQEICQYVGRCPSFRKDHLCTRTANIVSFSVHGNGMFRWTCFSCCSSDAPAARFMPMHCKHYLRIHGGPTQDVILGFLPFSVRISDTAIVHFVICSWVTEFDFVTHVLSCIFHFRHCPLHRHAN